MKRFKIYLSIIFIFTFGILLGAPPPPPTYWYQIQWTPNNAWLNDSSTQLLWDGFTEKDTGTFGVQKDEATPPSGMSFDPNLTMVVSSEPHLSEFRLTKIGDPNKYFRAYLTFTKISGLQIDTPLPEDYITITLQNWKYWGGNFHLNIRSNEGYFPDDTGFNGIYATYFRFRLYPTAHLLDDDYLLLDETMYYNLKYWGSGVYVATSLAVTPFTNYVDVISLQQTSTNLDVGSVEFMSDDSSTSKVYKIKVTPGELNSTQFAFHRTDGTAPAITYSVRIDNGLFNPSSLTRTVTTKDSNNHWYDFFTLSIGGLQPYVVYKSGSYESSIKFELVSE